MNNKELYEFDNNSFDYRKVSWFEQHKGSVVLLLLLITALTLLSLSKGEVKVKEKIIEGEEVSTIIVPEPEFSPKLLREYLADVNIKHPDIVYAQMVLETGNFTSSIFKENHNLCGMKCAQSRPYTHQGPERGHAVYEDWKMSVLDYALYQSSYLRDLKSEAQYYEYLGKHYAEDPNYVSKLKTIVKKLRNGRKTNN